MTQACWLKNDNPYGESYDHVGHVCNNYGASDYVVAISVLSVLGLILVVLLVGWIVRYSRNAARFSRFWNQPAQDYELKQHHQQLLYDDAASVRTGRTSLGPPPSTTTTGGASGRHGRSPLSSYGGHDDEPMDLRDDSYASTGYGQGGLGVRGGQPGAAEDFPSGGSNQFYPGQEAPAWQAFPSGPSTSQVNLHAASEERRGFLGGLASQPSAMSSTASFGGRPDLPVVDRFSTGGPNQYQQQQQQQYQQHPYGDPYQGR